MNGSVLIPQNGIDFIDLGLIDYEEALGIQEEAAKDVADGGQERIFFCSHPEIVTIGRRASEEDFKGWAGKTLAVSRGGKATYHGPSQLVVYPILRIKDVKCFIASLENCFVQLLKIYGLKAEGKSSLDSTGAYTGVWVGSRKLVSVGIAVKRWVTLHGAAINLDDSDTAFRGMNPCGFSAETMISLEDLLGCKIDRSEVKSRLREELLKLVKPPSCNS